MDVARARSLVEQIKSSVSVARDALSEAWHDRAWIPLGYESWDALCDAEFEGVRLQLPASERRQEVEGLHREGLSTPAIASALGISQPTAWRDTQAYSNEYPKPAPRVDFHTGEVLDDVPQSLPERVTGVDGKSYPARRPVPANPPPRDETQVELENARQNCQAFARALALLNEWAIPQARDRFRHQWDIGADGASPAVRVYMTPDKMRETRDALTKYINESEAAK